MAYQYETIAVESNAGIVVARFAHPDDDGASIRQLDDFLELLRELQRDSALRVVVLTGEGERFFTGPHLTAIAERRKDPKVVVEGMLVARRTVESLLAIEQPLVAAVNGPAIGLGTQIALFCDFVIANRTAWFQDTHVKIGVAAGDGAALVWPLVMGLARSKFYLLTGRRLHADRAFEIGAIAEVVDEGVEERALEYAADLASLPEFALRATKSALNQWLRLGALTAFNYSFALQLSSQLMPEAQQTIDELVERQRRKESGS
jgi:enoyl-CoA hydratase